MFCYRCGNELPTKSNVCPICDTPQKRKQRRRQKLFWGLLIFLSGAFVGSFVDSFIFKGKSWENQFLRFFQTQPQEIASATGNPISVPNPVIISKPQIQELATETTTGSAAKELSGNYERIVVPHEIMTTKYATESIHSETATESTIINQQTDIVATISAEHETVATNSNVVSDQTLIPDDFKIEIESISPLVEGNSNNYHGSLSGDGKTLIFSSNRETGSSKNLYQCFWSPFPPSGPVTRLFPWNGNVWTPEFSRDGSYLVFSSDSTPAEHIFIRELTSQQVRQLTDGKSKNMMPAISPDSKLVAFTSNRKGNNDIWIIGVDGQGLVQITSGPEDDREPRWTNDGTALVFTRIIEKYKRSKIMRISLNPLGEPETLVDDQARNWLPDISPDGRFLAFVRSKGTDGSNNEIHIRHLKNKEEIILAPFKGSEHYRPIWTSTGDGIVFHADRNKSKCLYFAKVKRTPIY